MIYTPHQGGLNIPEYEFKNFKEEIEPLEQVQWFLKRDGFVGLKLEVKCE